MIIYSCARTHAQGYTLVHINRILHGLGKIFDHSGFSGLENFQITGDPPSSKKAGLIENLSCFDLAN